MVTTSHIMAFHVLLNQRVEGHMVTTIHNVAYSTPLPRHCVEGHMVTTIHLAFNRITLIVSLGSKAAVT